MTALITVTGWLSVGALIERGDKLQAIADVATQTMELRIRRLVYERQYDAESAAAMNATLDKVDASVKKARGMVVTVPHAVAGTFRMLGNPIKMQDKDPVYSSPPLLGQHTEEVLAGLLGYSGEKIAALRAQGVIR